MTKLAPFRYKQPAINQRNPYTFPAGPDLDGLIHQRLFKSPLSGTIPPYSTDPAWAERVKSKMKSDFQKAVLTGRTRIRSKPYFARYETDSSDGTEVLGESYPLVVCRLALLLALKEGNA